MRHRERPPVEEQGRSPQFTPGVETPVRALGPRAAGAVWAVVTLLVAGYATALTLQLAGSEVPSTTAGLLIVAVLLVRWGLQGNSIARPAASRPQKVLGIVSIVLGVSWLGTLVWVFFADVHSSNPLVLAAFCTATAGLVMAGLVFGYRARFFAARTGRAGR